MLDQETWSLLSFKMALIYNWLHSYTLSITRATGWIVLRWAVRLGILGFILHYCWYQFVWKRLTRIPDDVVRQTILNKPNTIMAESLNVQGELTYTMKKERLSRIGPVGEFLEALEIFGYFEVGVKEILASMAREVFVKRGQVVAAGNLDIIILKQGRARIWSSGNEENLSTQELMINLPGLLVTSLFNIAVALVDVENSELLNSGFQRLSAVAEEDSVFVVIPSDAFKMVKERMPLQARQMVQVLFARFQRITCSGLLRHLGLVDDLAPVEMAASTCTTGIAASLFSKHSESQCLDEIYSMECLEELQKKAVKAILGALKIGTSNAVLDVTDIAYEARVECVVADQLISNDCLYYVSAGAVIISSSENNAVQYVTSDGCLIATSILLGGQCHLRYRAMTNCVLVRIERTSISRLFEKLPNSYEALVHLLVPRVNAFLAFIDLGLNWIHLDAGTPLCFQDDSVSAFYIVVHGRLRSVRRVKKGRVFGSGFDGDKVAEVGCGGSFGEVEIINQSNWPGTVFAIRDSELVRVPRDLFDMLLKARPSVTSRLAKAIAVRTPFCPDAGMPIDYGREDRQNIKTLAIIPLSTRYMSIAEEFCARLYKTISASDSVAILTKSSVLDALGRHAFTAYGKLRLLEWLNGLEDQNRIVIYFAADAPNSAWTKQCIRQADCVFLVADAKGNGIGGEDAACEEVGEYEESLLSLANRPKIELVLIHPTHHCTSGLSRSWLKPRPWISQHHHIMLPSTSSKRSKCNSIDRQQKRHVQHFIWNDIADQLLSYGFIYQNDGLCDEDNVKMDYSSDDIGRLARRVLGTSVGLVLGGGGARGISHVGVIKAFVEAGIPIDIVGGTSIGALVGGLYCRDTNQYTCQALLSAFSSRMSSKWRMAYDLTYPFCAWFTGEFFNRGLWKIFERRFLEDMWIPFFCVTTDITRSKMRIHREGSSWRYIRASMSLSGFLPPLWDSGEDGSGSLLLDGGYVNNLPVDVMFNDHDHVRTVIAIDVGSERSLSDEWMEDEISGGWLLLKSLLGLRVRVPNLADIQSRLAYVSCAEGIRRVKEAAEDPASRVHYLRPPVQQFATLEFEKFKTILEAGEAYGREIVGRWRADGTLDQLKMGRSVYTEGTGANFHSGHQQVPDLGTGQRQPLHRRRRSV